jgi:hypothetical protein
MERHPPLREIFALPDSQSLKWGVQSITFDQNTKDNALSMRENDQCRFDDGSLDCFVATDRNQFQAFEGRMGLVLGDGSRFLELPTTQRIG